MRCYYSPPPYISSQSQRRGSHTTLTGRPSPPYQSTCVQSDRPGRTARSVPPPHSDPESLQKEPEDPQSSVTTRAPLQQHLSTTSPDWIQQERAGEEES